MIRRHGPMAWLAAGVVGFAASHLLDGAGFRWSRTIELARLEEQDWYKLFRVAGYLPTWVLVGLALILVDRKRLTGRPVREVARRGAALVLAATGSGLLAELLKMAVGRARPIVTGGRYEFRAFLRGFVESADLGLPSSHAAVAFGAGFALLALHRPLWPLAALLGAGCAAGRVASGAHFVSDTVGSLVVGLAGAMLAARLTRGWEGRGAAGDRGGGAES
ncbi:MAG: phosphatase PAP2 family protein [Phycisphaerae bacterium]|nr:phosphatase PAP2 family protein [Phycisphaerae bacterium]